MKKIFLALTLCILTIMLCSCGKKADIELTCSSWNGWDADYEVEEKVYEYTVKEGDVITPDKGIVGSFLFKIVSIDDDSIIIETNQCMSGSDVDYKYIDLYSDETTFEIKKGEKIKLKTTTTDCGDTYIIEYK